MATAPLNNLADTWNNNTLVFNAIAMNVTDTGHAAGSNLLLLSVGGTTRFSVDPNGNVFANNIIPFLPTILDADFNTGNSTVLANIAGSAVNLSANVAAGHNYAFVVELYTTSNVAAGVQFAIGGTCVASNIVYEALVFNAAAVSAQTRAAALGASVGAVTAVTAAKCTLTGSITVATAGTLTVQMAQNVGNAAGSIAKRGSSFLVWQTS